MWNNPTSPNSCPEDATPVDRIVQPCACAFDVTIKLIDHRDCKRLTPLRVPDYEELASGTSKNQDYIEFEIEVKENPVDKLEIIIAVENAPGRRRIFFDDLKRERAVGIHHWRWDGYSTAGVLDTKVLKDPDLRLELRAELCGETKTEILAFDNQTDAEDWVDVIINRNNKTVAVELRTNIKDGGENGVGDAPPSEIWANPNAKMIPPGDARRRPHVRARSFGDLKNLVLSGLEEYWSRNVSRGYSIATPAGAYTVDVKAVSATDKAMDDISVKYNTNAEWGRSSNPGSVRGILSLGANTVPERIIYNAGWIKYADGWFYSPPADVDAEFQETAAHEIGHEILSAYGGELYSYRHKGSSTLITQKTLDPSSGGITYPSTGEIDLMKYLSGNRPWDYRQRLVASEADVKSLVWLARVVFSAHGVRK